MLTRLHRGRRGRGQVDARDAPRAAWKLAAENTATQMLALNPAPPGYSASFVQAGLRPAGMGTTGHTWGRSVSVTVPPHCSNEARTHE